jgi:hypothetical protein
MARKSEISQEIENILAYIKSSTDEATSKRRFFLENALRYYNALFDWQSCFYFGRTEHMGTAELIGECVIDMESSILQVTAGFWKPAFFSLRSCLEMGVLLVYFFVQSSPEDYDKFFEGKKGTPFFSRELIPTIFKTEPFKSYNSAYNLKERIKQEYWTLCSHTHTKGWKYFEGHLRGVINGTKFYTKTHPLNVKEIWENWLSEVRSVYQNISLLFALATPTFCYLLRKEQLPRSEKFRNILMMMNDQDVRQLTEFVKKMRIGPAKVF